MWGHTWRSPPEGGVSPSLLNRARGSKHSDPFFLYFFFFGGGGYPHAVLASPTDGYYVAPEYGPTLYQVRIKGKQRKTKKKEAFPAAMTAFALNCLPLQ